MAQTAQYYNLWILRFHNTMELSFDNHTISSGFAFFCLLIICIIGLDGIFFLKI